MRLIRFKGRLGRSSAALAICLLVMGADNVTNTSPQSGPLTVVSWIKPGGSFQNGAVMTATAQYEWRTEVPPDEGAVTKNYLPGDLVNLVGNQWTVEDDGLQILNGPEGYWVAGVTEWLGSPPLGEPLPNDGDNMTSGPIIPGP
jgi:hypothetical protein